MNPPFDDRPRLPLPTLGRIDPGARNGLLGARLPVLPTSVWEIKPADLYERMLKEYVGDTGQLRGSADHFSDSKHAASVFSPTVALTAILDYSDPGDLVIDPFAGGGTRAVVAALAGRRYLGLDVREDEVERVNARIAGLGLADLARVIHADASDFPWADEVGRGVAGLVLTCPPYWNLEVYSEDPRDLSTASTYGAFLDGIEAVVRALVPALRRDAFSAWVLGRIAHPHTRELLDLPGHVEDLHRRLGFRAHDRIVVHTRAQQARRIGQFETTRRTVRAHEEIVVTRHLPDEGRDGRADSPFPGRA